MRLYYRHLKSVPSKSGRGYCASGVRAFAKRYNFDYLDFCKNGIDIKDLKNHTDDIMVAEAIKQAEAEYGKF